MSAVVTVNRSFETQLTTIIDNGLRGAVRELRDNVRRRIHDPFPPPSQPFTPPHMRSGGLDKSVFAEKIKKMDWAFGYRRVRPHPDGRDRSNLGVWMELGSFNVRSGRMNLPRPTLIPTLHEDGPGVIAKHLSSTVAPEIRGSVWLRGHMGGGGG